MFIEILEADFQRKAKNTGRPKMGAWAHSLISYLHHKYLSHLKITLKLFPQINENAEDI